MDLAGALESYEQNPEIRKYVDHNVWYWRAVHGGHYLLKTYQYEFDPRDQYWHRTERRILVAYFAHRFRESYAPAVALRSLAFKTFVYFDTARKGGTFGEPLLVDEASWNEELDKIRRVADRLPTYDEYKNLKGVWRQLAADTLRDDFMEFLDRAAVEAEPGSIEPPFYQRIPWFPYIELSRLEDLRPRQAFFYGYYLGFTSTNSYFQGGAIGFAPVLQNNDTGKLISYLDRWIAGETPRETGFDVYGRDELVDKSHHMPVAELFGFLRLQEYPLYNSVSAPAFRQGDDGGQEDIYDLLAMVGARTKRFLNDNQSMISELARRFVDRVRETKEPYLLAMEGIRSPAVRKKVPEELDQQVDSGLQKEVEDSALERARSLSKADAATAFLHLVLDASLYSQKQSAKSVPPKIGKQKVKEGLPKGTTALDHAVLPETLRAVSNDALGLLRAGYHVLFAGPPGTGKTTVAQFVGHAWNNDLEEVQDLLPLDSFPATVVGNSSWATFHTIGGIMPDENNKWRAVRGIFIDPQSDRGDAWQLRPEAIVLDEMNRADLDRCIGDLYPLLSQSVGSVQPTGLPGVRSIRQNERFRLIATVNDATLDDIVFPISEGLARRFMRLELHGAARRELLGYIATGNEARAGAAAEIVDELYTRLSERDRVERTDVEDYLPFGVGYFKPLRSWVQGRLNLSSAFEERDLKDQARELVRISLRSGARVRNLQWVLEALDIA